MNLDQFLIMRQELLLTLLAVFILIADLATGKDQKVSMIPFSIILFFSVTIAGFFPSPEGVLFGGMYQSNGLTLMMKNILNIGVFIIFLQATSWLRKEENIEKISEFFILLICTLIGMDFMISSGDFLMFYIGLELATIPLAALAAYDKYKLISAEAGIKLIMSSALSSGILLFGLSMLYATTGSIYFSEVAAGINGSPLQILALIFFITGMGFKISLVPFHLWTADVYEGAPVSVTSYLSVVSKGAAAFIFIIILFTVFRTVAEQWINAIYILSIATMTIGNLFAIRQNNLKRFLAFSSIAQAGFILLGILGANSLGMSSVVYFVLIYIFSNLAAFGVIASISDATGKENISDYKGLYRTNPKLSLVMMLALFSLAGIPPVAGFFGKFFLFTAAASNQFYWLVLIAVLNATISLYYYLLVIKAMFIDKSETPISYFKSGFNAKLAMLICVIGLFVIGFIGPLYEIIKSLSFGI